MTAYIIRRVLATIPVMLFVATGVFLILFLTPGDPASVILGPDAKPDQVEELRRQLGLDQPPHVQLGLWFARLFQGDLGNSIFLQRPVTVAIAERAEPTLILTLMACTISVVIGVPAGVLAATRRNSLVDLVAMLIATAGVSLPTFFVGLNLIFVFGVLLNWFPVGGYRPLSSGLFETLRSLVLPAVTLGLASAALLARITRSMMLDVLSEDYVRTARAKGLRELGVVVRHALRNALIPLVTVIGLSFALLLGGAVITETVFNIPGVGRLLIQAVSRRDYPVVQGIVFVIAAIYVLINLFVDLLYAALDPRVRHA